MAVLSTHWDNSQRLTSRQSHFLLSMHSATPSLNTSLLSDPTICSIPTILYSTPIWSGNPRKDNYNKLMCSVPPVQKHNVPYLIITLYTSCRHSTLAFKPATSPFLQFCIFLLIPRHSQFTGQRQSHLPCPAACWQAAGTSPAPQAACGSPRRRTRR